MDLICKLPAAPHAIIEHDNHRLILAFADGLALFDGTSRDFVMR